MPDREAIEAGTTFEKDFAKKTGSDLMPGSGNQFFATMDIEKVGVILWTLKSTQKESFPLSRALIDEVITEAQGPGGRGGSVIPGAALQIGKENPLRLVVLLEDDLLAMFQEHISLSRESRGEALRREAEVPQLLRGDEE